MNKKFATFLALTTLLLTGCSQTNEQKNIDASNRDFDEWFEQYDTEREEQKLKPICEQEVIPAEYASDCYFRELKKCDSSSGEIIPKDELNECVPYFLKEKIENIVY